jgi:hypothetical protein
VETVAPAVGLFSFFEEWRKLRDNEFPNLYCSPNIIIFIKSEKIRKAGLVAPMGEMRNAHKNFA